MEQNDWLNIYISWDGIFLDSVWLYIGIYSELIVGLAVIGVALRIRKVRRDNKRSKRRVTPSI
jgi:hypothetical protein